MVETSFLDLSYEKLSVDQENDDKMDADVLLKQANMTGVKSSTLINGQVIQQHDFSAFFPVCAPYLMPPMFKCFVINTNNSNRYIFSL